MRTKSAVGATGRSPDKNKISFTIPIDPIPYLRMTQAEAALMRIPRTRVKVATLQRWHAVRRYLEYKKAEPELYRLKRKPSVGNPPANAGRKERFGQSSSTRSLAAPRSG